MKRSLRCTLISLSSIFLPLSITGSALSEAARQGRVDYVRLCSGCHGLDGQGAPKAGVPELDCRFLNILRHKDGKRYVLNVAGVRNSHLSRTRVLDIYRYVTESFCKAGITATDIKFSVEDERLLDDPDIDIVGLRRNITQYLSEKGLDSPSYPW